MGSQNSPGELALLVAHNGWVGLAVAIEVGGAGVSPATPHWVVCVAPLLLLMIHQMPSPSRQMPCCRVNGE